jgi:hypothetical protein
VRERRPSEFSAGGGEKKFRDVVCDMGGRDVGRAGPARGGGHGAVATHFLFAFLSRLFSGLPLCVFVCVCVCLCVCVCVCVCTHTHMSTVAGTMGDASEAFSRHWGG